MVESIRQAIDKGQNSSGFKTVPYGIEEITSACDQEQLLLKSTLCSLTQE